ncbi:MAG: YbhB/YbcL family Raf kinase inhibitor-like protein [Bacteroidetes bacterium]|nr:YbhB/YbcL family Raf kinase inhibitor-like protein [Bacteroidota bacterium]
MRTVLFVLFFCAFGLSASAQDSSLTVTSPAFANNGMIPSKYTCEGRQVSPPLHIANIPKGTQFLAIIVFDPDAPFSGGYTHWLIWNIPVNTRTEMDIPENFSGGDEGINSSKKRGYVGMCPPSGTHHYHFYVYAQKLKVQADQNVEKTNLEARLEGHIAARAELVGLYQKTKH